MVAIDDIDELILREKEVIGHLSWSIDNSGPRVALLVAPLMMQGVVSSGLELRARASLHAAPQRGSAILMAYGRAVARMNINPSGAHANPWRPDVSPTHRGLTLPGGMTRIYPWALNREWPRSRASPDVGELVNDCGTEFGQGLAWFARYCNVVGDIPSPPWEPRLF